MGWVGLKRGIYLLLPIQLIIGYLFILKENNTKVSFFKNIIVFIIVTFFIISIGGKYTPSLNPENKVGGSFDLSYIYEYSESYLTQETQSGYTIGRYSSFFNALKQITYNKKSFFVGFGPGSLYGDITSFGSQKYSRFNIFGGITGSTFYLISLGFLGTLINILFYIKLGKVLFKYKLKDINNSWKAIYLGTKLNLILLFLDFFLYSRISVNGNIPIFILIIMIAGIEKYAKKESLQSDKFHNYRP